MIKTVLLTVCIIFLLAVSHAQVFIGANAGFNYYSLAQPEDLYSYYNVNQGSLFGYSWSYWDMYLHDDLAEVGEVGEDRMAWGIPVIWKFKNNRFGLQSGFSVLKFSNQHVDSITHTYDQNALDAYPPLTEEYVNIETKTFEETVIPLNLVIEIAEGLKFKHWITTGFNFHFNSNFNKVYTSVGLNYMVLYQLGWKFTYVFTDINTFLYMGHETPTPTDLVKFCATPKVGVIVALGKSSRE